MFKKRRMVGHNMCTNCQEGYYGTNCELTKCYGILSNNSNACSRNGICVNSNSI